MSITLATQYPFTGSYTVKVDPRGRISLPVDIVQGLEERVYTTVLGDPDMRMSPHGIQYQGQWVYISREDTSQRRRIGEIIENAKQRDPDAPDVLYKSILLDAKILIDPVMEARKVITRHWQYYEKGEKREYTTMRLYLEDVIREIRRHEKKEERTELQRVTADIYCSTQRYEIDDAGRICFGKNHEILREALDGDREIVILGMQDMLLLMTPKEREMLQKQESKLLKEQELIPLVRT